LVRGFGGSGRDEGDGRVSQWQGAGGCYSTGGWYSTEGQARHTPKDARGYMTRSDTVVCCSVVWCGAVWCCGRTRCGAGRYETPSATTLAHVFSGRCADAPRCPQHSMSLGSLIGIGFGVDAPVSEEMPMPMPLPLPLGRGWTSMAMMRMRAQPSGVE
jgi:hypothetical protein